MLHTAACKIAVKYWFQFLLGLHAQNTKVTGGKEKIQMRKQGRDFEHPQETRLRRLEGQGRERSLLKPHLSHLWVSSSWQETAESLAITRKYFGPIVKFHMKGSLPLPLGRM